MKTFLFGAGASAEAGVPLAKEMARRFYEDYRKVEPFARAVQVAIAGLKSHRSIEGDPFGEIDVEDLYETLIALRDRRQSSIAPFVGAWSDHLSTSERPTLLREAARHTREMLERELIDSINAATRAGRPVSIDLRSYENALQEALTIAAGETTEVFEDAARFVLQTLPMYCWVRDEKHVEYLRPLMESSKKSPLWIATLNYDNTVELAAKASDVDVDLGIHDGHPSVQFKGMAKVTLAKLHGSLNWESLPDGILRTSDIRAGNAALIFGSGNKLQVEGPYLDLLFAFRDRLTESHELHVCGYSFRDPHINYVILRWLQQKDDRKLFIRDAYLSASQLIRNMNKGMKRGWSINTSWFSQRMSYEQLKTSEWLRNL